MMEVDIRVRSSLFCVLLISGFLLLSGCAHVISKNLRAEADPTLSFSRVLQNPEAFKGKTVIWGGEVVETTNQKDGSTLIEVLERRLDRQGEPDEASPSQGRFLVQSQDYLDPYVYRRGRKVTVAGVILGQKVKPLGEMDYRYPLVSIKQLHLWPVYYYAPAPYYPYPYYYDPWWRPAPWYPWGYYPYRWGFGFRY
jgi:outer membrane lipoprotein